MSRGAYGEIWLALAPDNHYRAIKYIPKDGSIHECRHARERRAIQLLQTLQDIPSGIVPILDVREDRQVGFGYVMELADSERPLWRNHPEEYRPRTLHSELIARRALPLAECLHIGIRLAGALDFLQRYRLLHRDIKPSNVIYIQDQPVLADVGLLVDTREADSIVGTPGYAPAEQHGHFSGDIYSLGILLTEISTGRPANEHGFAPVEEADTDAPGYARWLKILARAAHSNPRKRHQTASALLRDLQTLLAARSGSPGSRSAWQWVIAGIALLVAGWFGIGFFYRPAPPKPEQPAESNHIAEPVPQNLQPTTSPNQANIATTQWEAWPIQWERFMEMGAFNTPRYYPPEPHPATRTDFTISDDAAQDGVFLKTYPDRILIGKGSADNTTDWRLAMTHYPIGASRQALFLLPLTPLAPAEQPTDPPLRIWPPDTAENAQADAMVLIPPAILANTPPHHYPTWILLTTNAPEKWDAWMADNSAMLSNTALSLYRFREEWYHQYRFPFVPPSGNQALDKALQKLNFTLGTELLPKANP